MERIRVATRASQLALWQAEHVADLLREQNPDLNVELVDVTTSGDADQTSPLSQLGGTGVFTKEVQRAVLDGRADVAVHSLKDLPTEVIEPELTLAAVPGRAEKWDALVMPDSVTETVDEESPWYLLPEGARIGTGSLRRQAQILRYRPDFELAEIRGNLNTRLAKLDEGQYDAIILAAAGLLRLGWENRLSSMLTPPEMYPAIGQGALGLECRRDDEETIHALQGIADLETELCTTAERALLATLRAGCHAPVGADCRFNHEKTEILLTGVVLSRNGSEAVEATASLPISLPSASLPLDEEMRKGAANLGTEVAQELLAQGAERLMNEGG